MKIGIIGSGNIGGTLARLFVQAGHEVAISNSRGPGSLQAFVQELGPKAYAMTVEEAAKFGEAVVLAIPFRNPEGLPKPEWVKAKIVVDAMNPYAAQGGLIDLGNSSSSEETAKRLPGVRLVKAFNTIWFKHLAQSGRKDLPVEQRRAIFLAGDDKQAKEMVAQLIREIGFAPVDTGSLREGGKKQAPDTEIYNRELTGAQAKAMIAVQN